METGATERGLQPLRVCKDDDDDKDADDDKDEMINPAGMKKSVYTTSLFTGRGTLSTVGDHLFPVAGSRLWNSLPPDVTSAPTPTVFRNRLTTYFSPNHFLTNCFQFLVLYTVYSNVSK